MAFNVDTFRANLTGGGARPSLFDIICSNPIDPSGDLSLKFKCKAATLPPSNLGEIAVPYFGRDIYEAGDRTYEPWTITVINDEDFLIRNAYERWSAAINHPVNNIRNDGAGISANSYKGQAIVIQYSKSGVPIKAYHMHGVWPTNVGEIPVAWENKDQIEEFTMTLRYDYFLPIDANQAAAQLASDIL